MLYEQEIDQRGFAVQRRVVDEPILRVLEAAIDRFRTSPDGRHRKGELFGLRNLLASIPEVRGLTRSCPLRMLVEPILGIHAAAVRGLYFDKTRAANWRLGWHRDKAIAVKERIEVAGYGPWSVKAGVRHVFPPSDILREMLTIRLHLDACDETSGALKVIPGTHREPGLQEVDFQRLASGLGVAVCRVDRGDAVVMRPLIAHASDKCQEPSHRRIIHLEYAAAALSPPLEWNEYVPAQ